MVAACQYLDSLEAGLVDVPPLEWVAIPLDFCQWHDICRNVQHELCLLLHKAHELLHLIQVPWDPSISYPGHLVHIGVYAIVVDDMSKAVHSLSIQITPINLEVESKLPQ